MNVKAQLASHSGNSLWIKPTEGASSVPAGSDVSHKPRKGGATQVGERKAQHNIVVAAHSS